MAKKNTATETAEAVNETVAVPDAVPAEEEAAVNEKAAEPDSEEEKKSPFAVCESEYTMDELAAGAETAFGCMPEMVMAALMERRIERCTKAEAAEIVEAFKRKEVV